MGANSGTGSPIRLKCRSCKRAYPYENLYLTGNRRPLASGQRPGVIRMLDENVQYGCTVCGHVGWTRHRDTGRLKVRDAKPSRAPTNGSV